MWKTNKGKKNNKFRFVYCNGLYNLNILKESVDWQDKNDFLKLYGSERMPGEVVKSLKDRGIVCNIFTRDVKQNICLIS